MIRFQAVNDVVILVKDKGVSDSPLILPEAQPKNMYEIPEPYTGVIDSVGMENEWKRGDHIAFCEILVSQDIEHCDLRINRLPFVDNNNLSTPLQGLLKV